MKRCSFLSLIILAVALSIFRGPLLFAAQPGAGRAAVEITSPGPGRHFHRRDPIVFYANPAETARGIRKITYLINGRGAGTATEPPFRCEIAVSTLGRFQAVARAEMADGRAEQSAPVPFRITRNFGDMHPDARYYTLPSETPPPKVTRPKKQARPAGSAQKLLVRTVADPPTSPDYGYIGGSYYVTTNDGYPPNGRTLHLPAEGSVFDDAQMRRLRVHRWVPSKESWIPMESHLDEEKLIVSSTIPSEGFYCLTEAGVPPPTRLTIRWLAPGQGSLVKGRTVVAVAPQGAPPFDVEYYVQRHSGGKPDGPLMPLGSLVPSQIPRQAPAIDRTGPSRMLQNDGFEATLDTRFIASGTICLIAVVRDGRLREVSSQRTFQVESEAKLPHVSIDSAGYVEPGGPRIRATGTVGIGSLMLSGVRLYINGAETDAVEIQEPDSPDAVTVCWSCEMDLPDSVRRGPVVLKAIVRDETGNTAESASLSITSNRSE